jgi:hypothetical protein
MLYFHFAPTSQSFLNCNKRFVNEFALDCSTYNLHVLSNVSTVFCKLFCSGMFNTGTF